MTFDNLWWLPPNFSTYGEIIDNLFLVIMYITGITFFGVQGFLVYSLIKFRNKGPGHKALYTHGNHKLEIVWTAVPTIILVIIAVVSNRTWDDIKNSVPEDVNYVIKVEAQRFAWNVIYAGPDGKIDTEDDIEGDLGEIRVPVNEPVLIKLTSRDVIHSLFIPHLRVKQDAVPGALVNVWFEVTQTSTQETPYRIACAELCGRDHWSMKGSMVVRPRAEIDQWLAARTQ